MTGHQEALLAAVPLPAAAVEVGIEDHLVIVAEGEVVGQGSKKSVGKGVFIDDNAKRLRPWRQAVQAAAVEAMHEMHPGAARPLFPRGTAVWVEMTFTFRRPRSHYGTGRNFQTLKPGAPTFHLGFPDADKCQRSVLDALTSAGVWDDDRQAVHASGTRVYPGTVRDSLDIPGVVIRVRVLP